MSLPDSANQPAAPTPTVQKQRLNVYTMMLILSFIAICIACILLYVELNRFGNYPWWNTSEAKPDVSCVQPLQPGWPEAPGDKARGAHLARWA